MSYQEGSLSDLGRAFGSVSAVYSSVEQSSGRIVGFNGNDYGSTIAESVIKAIRIARAAKLPSEIDAKRKAMMPTFMGGSGDVVEDAALDTIFSFRAEFSGFVFSLVDSAPSEIAVASLRNFNILARWNALRSTDASMICSVGWLQVDNHVPSAPFKVAVRPDVSSKQTSSDQGLSDSVAEVDKSPLLVVALAFAPKHKSDILVRNYMSVFDVR